MTGKWKLYWLLFIVTLGFYLVMVIWSLPMISSQAAGLVPFDMRPGDYTSGEAREFIANLSPDGKEFYLGTQLWLDTFYPGLLAMVLGFGGLGMSRDRFRWLGYIIFTCAILGAGADYFENASIYDMLKAGTEGLSDKMIAKSSMFTLIKSISTSIAMVLILVLIMIRALGWLQLRKADR